MTEVTFADWLKLRRAAAGLTQRQLATASGITPRLISAYEGGVIPRPSDRKALENFLHPRPSQLLSIARGQVLEVVQSMGGSDVRVFGSVARGTDQADSDVDLLITFPPGADIVVLLAIEEEVSNLLTVPVDVASAGGSGPVLRQALADSVPL